MNHKNSLPFALVFGFALGILSFAPINSSFAQSDHHRLVPDRTWAELSQYHLAQLDATDAYDPFADYSEFEEASEEEADINFFRHGRFATLGFMGSYRTFTSTLGDLYDPTGAFGIFLTFFFDLRFALQIQFLTGDHNFNLRTNSINRTGNVGLTQLGAALKFYFNTQNLTRGIANLNPYISGGFSQVTRTVTVAGEEAFSKEGAMGVDLSAGVEIPIMAKKVFLGLQATYTLVTFKDENKELVILNERTGIFPTGDILQGIVTLGINF